MGFRDNRQSKRMLEKMGLNLEEMPNVDEVVIKTKEKDLIIKTPQ
ncbi:MAG TPA: Nascent polypeptide-associated complex protein, partial [Nitrososphaerales archaeon]|nr:Nascent polypeptide-associated complex protein [Nitrososphaerales archaeon]